MEEIEKVPGRLVKAKKTERFEREENAKKFSDDRSMKNCSFFKPTR